MKKSLNIIYFGEASILMDIYVENYKKMGIQVLVAGGIEEVQDYLKNYELRVIRVARS